MLRGIFGAPDYARRKRSSGTLRACSRRCTTASEFQDYLKQGRAEAGVGDGRPVPGSGSVRPNQLHRDLMTKGGLLKKVAPPLSRDADMRTADLTTALILIRGGRPGDLGDSLRLGIGWGTDGPQSGFFPFWLAVLLVLAPAWRSLWSAPAPRRGEPHALHHPRAGGGRCSARLLAVPGGLRTAHPVHRSLRGPGHAVHGLLHALVRDGTAGSR